MKLPRLGYDSEDKVCYFQTSNDRSLIHSDCVIHWWVAPCRTIFPMLLSQRDFHFHKIQEASVSLLQLYTTNLFCVFFKLKKPNLIKNEWPKLTWRQLTRTDSVAGSFAMKAKGKTAHRTSRYGWISFETNWILTYWTIGWKRDRIVTF